MPRASLTPFLIEFDNPSMLKYVLTGFGIFFILIACLALYYYQKAQLAVADVDEMCRLKTGTPVDVVIPLARSLHFSLETDFALGRGIEVYADGSVVPHKWTDDKLPGLKDGRIDVAKVVISPFLRHYCEIQFKDRLVVSTKKTVLD